MEGVDLFKKTPVDPGVDMFGLGLGHELRATCAHHAIMSSNPQRPMLKSVPQLYFDEAKHRYAYRGTWLQNSVTRIISDLTPEAKAQIDATKGGPDGWEARGNAVHKALEQHLLFSAGVSKQGVVMDEKWSEWIDPLLDHWLWEGCVVEAVELRLCDESLSLGGSFDFLISDRDGRRVLGDLKTVRTKKAVDSRKSAAAQLGAYVCLLNKSHRTYVDKCVTIIAGPGKTRLITEEPDHCVAEWMKCWDRFNANRVDV